VRVNINELKDKLAYNGAIGLFLGLILSRISLYLIYYSHTNSEMLHSLVKHSLLFTILFCGMVTVLTIISNEFFLKQK
jgi:hypothetical protein